MNVQADNQDSIDIELLKKDSNGILGKFIAIATFCGSVVNFITLGLFTNDHKLQTISYSIFLLILGAASVFLKKLKLSVKLENHILSIVLAAIIVTFVIRFENSSGLTVWAISLLCIIISVVSMNKISMVYNTAAAVSIEIYLWKKQPYLNVQISPSDYVGRIGIYLVALTLAYAINVMLAERIKNNAKHIQDIENKNKEIIKLHEDIYKLVSESTSDGIWSYDLIDKKQVYSKWWSITLGYSQTEILNAGTWLGVIHSSDAALVRDMFNDYLTHKTNNCEFECRMLTKDGSYLWTKARFKSLLDNNGSPTMIVGAFTNITPLKEKEEKLIKLAFHDELTGLLNRAYFMERLNYTLAEADEYKDKFYVVFIDLDNFKKVNDTLGHYYGDILLNEVACRFKTVVKEPNVLGRLGGDEFAIIVKEFKEFSQAEKFVQKLMASLSEPFKLENNRFVVNASFGISTFPEDGKKAGELLRNADTAMYSAKETGKKSYKFFSKSMETALLKKVVIENKLLGALEKEELYLVYQPQFSLKDNSIRGFEALIRWNNAELQFVPPMEFISLAEEIGYISTIGKWVLKTACIKFLELQKNLNYHGILSVNISPIQFKAPGFVKEIKEILFETKFDAKYLELEITENVFIDSFENAIFVFNELKELGIKVSLDDFGTGYSSLSYLQQLPINTLKIDKSFIKDIAGEGTKKDIVEAIIVLVHNMNISVIAEGVETEVQLNYLKKAKCDDIQGFLLGRPSTEPEAFVKAYRERSH